MPEPTMRTVIVRAGMPVTVGAVTILPVERVVQVAARGHRHLWWSVLKEPYALIVSDAQGVRVIDADAATVSVEALCGRAPGLDAALASILRGAEHDVDRPRV